MRYEHHAGRNRPRRTMTEFMTGPRRLAPSFAVSFHLARLDEDVFTIVEDYMSADQLASFREGLKPYLGTYRGRNPFEGLATERVYTLVGRGKVYEDIASDQRLLAMCAVTRRRFSSGCKPHPATAPAGSDRSRHGGDEVSEAFGERSRYTVTVRVCRPQRE